MIRFSDQPYQFFPPRYFGPTAWVLRQWNRRWLRTKLKIERVAVSGEDAIAALPANARLILLPNHPTHADASILIETCRQIGIRPRVMAAYDLYSRGALDGWILKRVGCFSVDREGSDKPAMDVAFRTIIESSAFKLTIFPEGNVYLENDHVTPMHDGAAFLAVRAAKQLAEQNVPVYVVPISIKATHLTDARPAITEHLQALAKDVGLRLDPSLSPLEALRAIGLTQLRTELNKRSLRIPNKGDLGELTQAAASELLSRIEPELELSPREDDTALDRVRAVRRVIHEIRTDPEHPDHARPHAVQLAEDAMLAFRVASYSGRYVADRPSVDRIGETVEKLYEDVHDQFLPAYAPRAALVRINPPIDVTARMNAGAKQKQTIHELSDAIEASVQGGLDALNASNHHPGKELWTTPLKVAPSL